MYPCSKKSPCKLVPFSSILEGGLASAAILISFGAVLGKLNPFQLLVMCLIEGAMFVGNSYLGYKVLGALDVGKNAGVVSEASNAKFELTGSQAH